jgi:hypothetical protein
MIFKSKVVVLSVTLFALNILVLSPILKSSLAFSNPVMVDYVETSGGAGDEQGTAFAGNMFGDVIVSGWTNSFGADSIDAFISKYDIAGYHSVTRVFGGSRNDYIYSMMITSDGKYVVVGYTTTFDQGSGDVLVSKFDANFNHEWSRVLLHGGVDIGYSVIETSDGNFVVAGYMSRSGYPFLLLVAFDTNGNLLWQISITSGRYSPVYSLTRTHDGGLAVTGSYTPLSSNFLTPFISKFNSSGVHQWTKLLAQSLNARGTSIIETASRDLAIAGLTFKSSSNTWDLFVAKCDSLGNNLWTRLINDSKMVDVYPSIARTYGDSLLVVGTTSNWGINNDVLLCMLDKNGNHIYTRTFGSDSADYGSALLMGSTRYFVAGSSRGWDANARDVLIAKFLIDGSTCTDVGTVNPVITAISVTTDTLTPQTENPSLNVYSWSPTISTVSPISTFVCWETSGAVGENQSAPALAGSAPGNIFLDSPSFFKNEIMLKFNQQSNDRLNLMLFGADGRIIFNKAMYHIPPYIRLKGRIIEELPAGIYFLHAVSAERMRLGVLKLIKVGE